MLFACSLTVAGQRLIEGDPRAFVDSSELDAQIDRAEAAFRAELKRQRAVAAD